MTEQPLARETEQPRSAVSDLDAEREARAGGSGATVNSDDPLATANGTALMPDGRRFVRAVENGEGDDATYDLHLEHGVVIQNVPRDHLYDPRKMDPKITQAAEHKDLPWLTPKEWRPFAVAVILAADPGETVGSRNEEARDWLAEYLEQKGGAFEVDVGDPEALYSVIADGHQPFRDSDGRLYVRPPDLLRFVNKEYGQRTTAQDLARRLAAHGFERPRNREGKLTARPPKGTRGEPKSRRYLASPPGFEV